MSADAVFNIQQALNPQFHFTYGTGEEAEDNFLSSSLTKREITFINNVVDNYNASGFEYVLYQIIEAVLSIFGASNWQDAERMLNDALVKDLTNNLKQNGYFLNTPEDVLSAQRVIDFTMQSSFINFGKRVMQSTRLEPTQQIAMQKLIRTVYEVMHDQICANFDNKSNVFAGQTFDATEYYEGVEQKHNERIAKLQTKLANTEEPEEQANLQRQIAKAQAKIIRAHIWIHKAPGTSRTTLDKLIYEVVQALLSVFGKSDEQRLQQLAEQSIDFEKLEQKVLKRAQTQSLSEEQAIAGLQQACDFFEVRNFKTLIVESNKYRHTEGNGLATTLSKSYGKVLVASQS